MMSLIHLSNFILMLLLQIDEEFDQFWKTKRKIDRSKGIEMFVTNRLSMTLEDHRERIVNLDRDRDRPEKICCGNERRN